MSPRGETYYSLLAVLRQSDLLDGAAQSRRRRPEPTRRRGQLFGLTLPQIRRSR